MDILQVQPTAHGQRGSDDLAELRLDGRVALITRSARGIGRATAQLLGRRGAAVALFDVEAGNLHRTANELASEQLDILALRGDVTQSEDCAAAVAACVERWGRLDILVNSAAIGGRSAPAWELTADEWRRLIDINLNGVFNCCCAAIRLMRIQGSGRIITIASIAGKEGNPNASHYSASKAAVIGLTKSLGKELATQGILVNAIAPAVIETEMLKEVGPDHVAYMTSRIPMNWVGRPEAVAGLRWGSEMDGGRAIGRRVLLTNVKTAAMLPTIVEWRSSREHLRDSCRNADCQPSRDERIPPLGTLTACAMPRAMRPFSIGPVSVCIL